MSLEPSDRPFDHPGDYASWPESERLRFIRHNIRRTPPGAIGPQELIADELALLLGRVRSLEAAQLPGRGRDPMPTAIEGCMELASLLLIEYRLAPSHVTVELARVIGDAARSWLTAHGMNHGQLGERPARLRQTDAASSGRHPTSLAEWAAASWRPCCGQCREPMLRTESSCVVCGAWWNGDEASAVEAAYRLAQSQQIPP